MGTATGWEGFNISLSTKQEHVAPSGSWALAVMPEPIL